MEFKTFFYSISWFLVLIMSAIFTTRIFFEYITKEPIYWCNTILTSLCNLYIPAFGMYMHFIGGSTILLVGSLQILPLFRKKELMFLHRILGNIYILACIITSTGGMLFILTNGTSGGPNMSIAFFIAGMVLFSFSIITYIYARKHNVEKHKEWAVRLYAQGLASMFYRISYFVLFLLGYQFTQTSDFKRPLDMILDWWFFLFPMFMAELWIRWPIIKYYICKLSFKKSEEQNELNQIL